MFMYKGIKNLLFDFGGVIASLDKNQAIARFKKIGIKNIEDYLNEFRQEGIFLEYEEGKLSAHKFYAALRELTGNKDLKAEDVDWAWLGFITEVPAYKLELLSELRKKYTLYLLSNTNPSVMGWADSRQFTDAQLPVSAYFDKNYMSYKIGYTKPDRRIFDYIIADSGLVPSETLFFDDGKSNIEMADKLGFQTHLTSQDEDWREIFKSVQ